MINYTRVSKKQHSNAFHINEMFLHVRSKSKQVYSKKSLIKCLQKFVNPRNDCASTLCCGSNHYNSSNLNQVYLNLVLRNNHLYILYLYLLKLTLVYIQIELVLIETIKNQPSNPVVLYSRPSKDQDIVQIYYYITIYN